MLSRKLFFLLIIAFFSNIYSTGTFAAIPIKERQQAGQKLARKIKEASAVYISRSLHQADISPAEEQEEKQDSGLIGSLAFAFGLIGVFPAAIVLGIIGMQRHRRERGLAIAGLILGILTIFLIAGMMLIIIYLN